MTPEEIRQIENFVLSQPLSRINHPENLRFLACLIQDHDHLREKLMSEPNRKLRYEKLELMRHYLQFTASPLDTYETAERERAKGIQPIYEEEKRMEEQRIWMPQSYIHEVRE